MGSHTRWEMNQFGSHVHLEDDYLFSSFRLEKQNHSNIVYRQEPPSSSAETGTFEATV